MKNKLDLELVSLTKRYGQTLAVDEISYHFGVGTYACLLGPSGCGKSSTLRMIAGHESVSSGAVTLGGRDISNLPPAKRGTAMMFQNYALFPHLTVIDNVVFSLKMRGVATEERRKRAMSMLDLVDMAALSDRLPAQLSGGQQQRVLLARALMQQSDVLLLDEPCSAIDPPSREHLLGVMRQQASSGQTLLVSSHDWGSALDSYDRVVVLDRKVLAAGSPADVRDKLNDMTCLMGSHCCG